MDYGASLLVAKSGDTSDQGDGTDVSVLSKYRVESKQDLAPGIPVGKRMPSVKVLNQSDARPWHLQELLPSNGRWRVIIFTGDISGEKQRGRLESAGKSLNDKGSFVYRFTPPGSAFDTVFEIFAVHSTPRQEVTIFDFPEVFRYYDEVDGYDYSKIYVDDLSYHEGHGKAYETFEISSAGCAVVVRPDQYVSYVGPMDDVDALDRFFSGFMASGRLVKLTNGANGDSGAQKVADAVKMHEL